VPSFSDLVEETANIHGEARITLTSSHGYKWAKKLSYTDLTTRIPDDGTSLLHLNAGFQRYCDSKLAVLYFALQLNKQLSFKNTTNVFVNACHPGNSPKTDIGDGNQPLISPFFQRALKNFLGLFLRNSTKDAAKTQVTLSASKKVGEEKVRGEFWVPIFDWRGYYVRSEKEELATELARDEEEWKRLWDCCEGAVAKFDIQRHQ
jgi:NAD(P)-dependent dehydrogenase (short-subunit alcohol dehydrogenase family)